MVKMVNFMLRGFYHNKKNEKEEQHNARGLLGGKLGAVVRTGEDSQQDDKARGR